MSRTNRARLAAGCLLGAAIIFFAGLGRPPLFEPDEGRYAEVAREMLLRSDLVTPRNDFVRYFEKPPLVYWTTAAALRVCGRNEFAVRMQAALFSAGEVAITADLGAAMFGLTAGLLGGLALTLSPLFFAFARFATPDPALAFFITAGLASFWYAARSPGFAARRARLLMLAAAGMLALGTLAKGPVALALAGAIALAWLIAQRRARDAIRLPWLGCVAVYLAIAAPWFALAAYRNPGFLEFFFVHEHLHRYLANNEHQWGPWFFIPVVIGGAWPWIFFAPIGIVAMRELDAGAASAADTSADAHADVAGGRPQLRSAILYLELWFAIIFIFFSIPSSKLGEYILPAMPPLAILCGLGLERFARMPRWRARRIAAAFALINLALVVAVTVAAYAIRAPVVATLRRDALAAAAALASGALAAFVITGRRRDRPAAWTLAAPLAIGAIVALGALAKAREDAAPFTSYRGISRVISPYLGVGCVLASYHHQIQALPFYIGVREVLVGYRGELAPFGDSPDAAPIFLATDPRLAQVWRARSCVIVIANRADVPHLRNLLMPAPSIIGCEGKKIALFNRPVRWFPAPPPACAGEFATSDGNPAK